MPFFVNLNKSFKCNFILGEATVVYSDYVKRRALVHYFNSKKPPIVQVVLRMYGNMQTYKLTRFVGRRPESGRLSKVDEEV